MKVKLFSDKILVEAEEETRSPSGVIISKNNDPSEPKIGKVVAVSKGKLNDKGELTPMTVKVGDTVMYNYGTKVQVEGKSYILASESSDVLLIL